METETCIRKVGRAPKLANLQKPRPLRQTTTSALKGIAEETNNNSEVNIQNLISEELMDRLSMGVLQNSLTNGQINNNAIVETMISSVSRKKAPRGSKLTRPPPMKKKSQAKSIEELETELLEFIERLIDGSFKLETSLTFRDFLTSYGADLEKNNTGLMEKCFECLEEYLSRGTVDTLVEINLKDVIFLRRHKWKTVPSPSVKKHQMGDNSGWTEIITSSQFDKIRQDENANDKENVDVAKSHRKVSTQMSVDSGYGEFEQVLWDCEEEVNRDLEQSNRDLEQSNQDLEQSNQDLEQSIVRKNSSNNNKETWSCNHGKEILSDIEEEWDRQVFITTSINKTVTNENFNGNSDENRNQQPKNDDVEWERHVYISKPINDTERSERCYIGAHQNDEEEWERTIYISSAKNDTKCPNVFKLSKSEDKDVNKISSVFRGMPQQEESWEDDIIEVNSEKSLNTANGFNRSITSNLVSKSSSLHSKGEWILDPPKLRNGFLRSVSVEEGLLTYSCGDRDLQKPICDMKVIPNQSRFRSERFFPQSEKRGFGKGFQRSDSWEDNAVKPNFKVESSKYVTNKGIRAPIGPGTSMDEVCKVEETMPDGMFTARYRRALFRRYKEATTDHVPDNDRVDRTYTRMELLCLSSSPMSKKVPGEWSYLQKIFPEVCISEVAEYFNHDTFYKKPEFPDFSKRPHALTRSHSAMS